MREKSRTNWLRIGVGLSSELSNVRRPIDKARIAAIVLRALPLFSDRTSAQSSFYFWPAKTWTIRVVVSWRFLYLFKFVTTKTKRKKVETKKSQRVEKHFEFCMNFYIDTWRVVESFVLLLLFGARHVFPFSCAPGNRKVISTDKSRKSVSNIAYWNFQLFSLFSGELKRKNAGKISLVKKKENK